MARLLGVDDEEKDGVWWDMAHSMGSTSSGGLGEAGLAI